MAILSVLYPCFFTLTTLQLDDAALLLYFENAFLIAFTDALSTYL